MLEGLLPRLAQVLDVPLVPLADLAGPDEASRLAAFDGWVSTAEPPAGRALLLERAEVVVLLLEAEPGSLRGLVRRTVRRIRADAEADLSWLDALPVEHPDLALVRLVGADAAERWLAGLAATT